MGLTLYILYALTQGILVARYLMREKEAPVFAVVMAAIFAPLLSFFLIGFGFYLAVNWLVTYKQ